MTHPERLRTSDQPTPSNALEAVLNRARMSVAKTTHDPRDDGVAWGPLGPALSATPSRPNLSAALLAVTRAADLMKADRERTAVIEDRVRALADQVTRAASQFDALQDRAFAAEHTLDIVTAHWTAALDQADAEIEALRQQLRTCSDDALAAEARAAGELRAAHERIAEAEVRESVAETRAAEALDDLVALEKVIRETFPLDRAAPLAVAA